MNNDHDPTTELPARMDPVRAGMLNPELFSVGELVAELHECPSGLAQMEYRIYVDGRLLIVIGINPDALPAWGVQAIRDAQIAVECLVCEKPIPDWEVGDEQFCSDDCSYTDARATGWVSDAEHEQNVAEGWVPQAAL